MHPVRPVCRVPGLDAEPAAWRSGGRDVIRDQDGGAVDPVVGQVAQRLVGPGHRVGVAETRMPMPGRLGQELLAVAAGVGRHAAQRPLLEEVVLVVQRRARR